MRSNLETSAISQSSISPVRTVRRNASSFITGKAPGSPRQIGQVWEFGSAPNSTGQAQNIFDRVFNCACTSRPIVVRYFIPSVPSHKVHQGHSENSGGSSEIGRASCRERVELRVGDG